MPRESHLRAMIMAGLITIVSLIVLLAVGIPPALGAGSSVAGCGGG
jgi:hypothetical protein